MKIELAENNNTCEAMIEGRLDSAHAPEAEEQLKAAADKYDTLILNLEKLEWSSSAGMRVFKSLNSRMTKKGGTLIFRNVGESVMKVFDWMGFSAFFNIENPEK